ncbi:MAG: hypothetical protein R3E01_27595 [Pirellulaceae bacterium]
MLSRRSWITIAIRHDEVRHSARLRTHSAISLRHFYVFPTFHTPLSPPGDQHLRVGEAESSVGWSGRDDGTPVAGVTACRPGSTLQIPDVFAHNHRRRGVSNSLVSEVDDTGNGAIVDGRRTHAIGDVNQ